MYQPTSPQSRWHRVLRRPALAIGTGLVAVAGGLALPSAAAHAAPAPSSSASVTQAATTSGLSASQLNIRSRVVGSTANGRQVTGHFTPRHFFKRNGMLKVRGVLHAAIHRKDGTVRHITQYGVRFTVKSISTPSSLIPGASAREMKVAREANAALAAGTCNILNLVLGPLDLNLLGLQVHLDKVVLNIIAATGAGNLLGNLLCAVAGLLDGTQLAGLLGQVSVLLNSILAILNL